MMPRPSSQLIQTSRGAIEFATRGTGAAVLICHGTGGGYDQGLVIARLLDGFQAIAVSRAGYLRTPLETGRSPAELADAYAALLDSLKVEKAAILGVSGGGMSAAHFAWRHPDRCCGLILADAISKAPPNSSVKIVQRANSLPDGIAWFITRLAIYIGLPFMVRNAKTRSLLRVFFENNPISERRAGVRNDLEHVHAMDSFPWETLRAPTLLVHGDRDRLIPLDYSLEVAHRVPNVKFVVVKGGGHECLVSHQYEVAPLLRLFIDKHVSA